MIEEKIKQSNTYRVVSQGLKDKNCDLELVLNKLTKAFKLNSDRAKIFLGEKTIIVKRNLSLIQAQKYKNKLESIGLIIELVNEPSELSLQEQELSLAPIENERKRPSPLEQDENAYSKESEVSCYICGFKQQKVNFCISCGTSLKNLSSHYSESMEPNNPEVTSERSILSSLVICLLCGILGVVIYNYLLAGLLPKQGIVSGGVKGGIAGFIMGLIIEKTGPHKISMTYLIIASLIICFFGDWFFEQWLY